MQKSGNNWIVSIDEIEIEDGFNARFDYGNIQQLSKSIIENGLKIPLRGIKKDDKFILTDGHRRFKAIQLAYDNGYTDIRITVSPEQKQSQEERVLSMITYNSGKPFEMLEEADIYHRLTNWGWKAKEISDKVGKSTQWVRDCLLLMQATKTMKNQIMKGLVSGSAVVEMMKKDSTENVEAKISKAIDSNEGKKVSNKHIQSKRPDKKQIQTLINKVTDEKLSLALKSFLKFQDGQLTEYKFLVAVDEIVEA